LAPRLHQWSTSRFGRFALPHAHPEIAGKLIGRIDRPGRSQMFRKMLFALAAIVALGAAGMASTAEAGHGHGGSHGCGYGGGHGHGHYHGHYGGYRGYGGYGYGGPVAVRSYYGSPYSPYYGGYGYGRSGYGGYPNYYRGYGSGVSFSIGF
jgi:hypothetical protein